MSRTLPHAQAKSLGLFVSLAAFLLVLACGPEPPTPNQGRQVWSGPGGGVASTGVTVYDRREIAQRVNLPACIQIADVAFTFATVERQPTTPPPGLVDTMYSLDRWRLWSDPGALGNARRVYVTTRGSTGILAVYERASTPTCA